MNSKDRFSEQQKAKVREIEEILKTFLPKEEGYQKIIMEAMEYSLLAGGKRLRPMLMQETYLLFSGGVKRKEDADALHSFMAAQDNDDYRRGRKTTHVVYGEDMGILAGDALLNYAFETAALAFESRTADGAKVGRALGILSRKAGIYGMIGGQVIDVKETGHEVSEDMLDTIYKLKTSALIESSMMIGAVLGGAEDADVRAVERIAGNVGHAFQIQDDILDVTGQEEALGKPVHSDEKNKKTTYVTLCGISEAKRIVEEKSREAISGLKALPGVNEYLEQLLLYLINRER